MELCNHLKEKCGLNGRQKKTCRKRKKPWGKKAGNVDRNHDSYFNQVLHFPFLPTYDTRA